MTKFLLDANFLTIPGKFKVDVFSQLEEFGKPELFVLDIVIGELEKLRQKGGSDAIFARMGLDFIEDKGIKILLAKCRNADEEMLNLAGKGYIVCTQDAGLIKKLKAKKKPAITLRQKRYLVKA